MTEQATAAIVINGYQVSARWDDGLARTRDVELGQRAGFTRPRKIRALIKRVESTGKYGDFHQRSTVERSETSRGAKHVHEYWLTERQALQVLRRCETPIADAIFDEVIDVFMAWRAGTLAPVTPQLPVQAFDALLAKVAALEAKLAELSEGTISRAMLCQLRSEVRRISVLETALRHWPSKRAATAGIYRDIGQACGWGGKGQPWKYLPAGLTHRVFVALRQREASIRCELRVLAADQQLDLPLH